MLSSPGIAEQLCLVFGSDDLQEIAFIPALEKAGAALRVLDEIEFGCFELQGVHVLTGIDIPGVE